MSRTRMKIPEVLRREELLRLMMAIDQPRMMVGVLLGYICGLRISEVVKLRKQDFELDKKRSYVKIHNSKFGKSRPVPLIIPKFVKLLKGYFELIPDSDYIIWSKKGNGKPIDKSTYREEFEYYLGRAGLIFPFFKDKLGRTRKKYHFHTLRHTIATHLIEAGVGESFVQKFLGHSDLATVAIYTHIASPVLHDTLAAAFKGKVQKKELPDPFQQEPKSFVEVEKLKLEVEKLKLEKQKLELQNMVPNQFKASPSYLG